MNQILTVEMNRNKSTSKTPIEIKNIVRFFAIIIMIFGLTLSGEGCYAIYKNMEALKPTNIPSVTISRKNDQAIVNITNNTEIMKITYSWDNGEENVVPVNDFSVQESITLLGYDSTLNLTIEDINGKQVNYQKQYILNGVDITKPQIAINTENGSNKMEIVATDETAMSHIVYAWEGEEENVVNIQEQGQKEIKKELSLTPGTRKIKVTAEDLNGNIEQIEKEIITSTSKPEMYISTNKDEFFVNVKDKDGIKDITINLNGQVFSSKNINKKEVKAGPLKLKQGNNTISIEVTNVSGYKQTATTELQYNP